MRKVAAQRRGVGERLLFKMRLIKGNWAYDQRTVKTIGGAMETAEAPHHFAFNLFGSLLLKRGSLIILHGRLRSKARFGGHQFQKKQTPRRGKFFSKDRDLNGCQSIRPMEETRFRKQGVPRMAGG